MRKIFIRVKRENLPEMEGSETTPKTERLLRQNTTLQFVANPKLLVAHFNLLLIIFMPPPPSDLTV
jgi:hypothetical protein